VSKAGMSAGSDVALRLPESREDPSAEAPAQKPLAPTHRPQQSESRADIQGHVDSGVQKRQLFGVRRAFRAAKARHRNVMHWLFPTRLSP
jgi:hypothetical protein